MAEWTLRRRRGLALIIGIPVLLVGSRAGRSPTRPCSAPGTSASKGRARSPRTTCERWQGSTDSTNVVHLDRETVVHNLEASPWVADASVRVELPDTLVLEVTERRPVGVIDAMGERGILASDATVLPPVAGVPEGLPIVRAALGAPDEDQRRAAASLLGALDPVVVSRLAGVSVGQDGLVTLHLRSGTTVRAGETGDEGAKAEALRAVLRWAASGGLDLMSIDVSAPTAPSVTLPGWVHTGTLTLRRYEPKCHGDQQPHVFFGSFAHLTTLVTTCTVATLTEGTYDNKYVLDG